MIVCCDMDGVLSDFDLQFRKRIAKAGLDSVQSKSWRLEDRIEGIPNNLKKNYINTILSTPGFWSTMPAIEGAIHGINKLLENKRIKTFIVTSPWYSAENCVPEKLKWIRKHIPKMPFGNIIFISPKFLIKGDIIIDDKPEHIKQWQGSHAICYRQPWNEDVIPGVPDSTTVFKANNWDSVNSIIKFITCDPTLG